MATTANPNWSRWIFASLTDHFNSLRQTIPFFVEGEIRSSEIANFAEFRMDGPFFNEINVRHWHIDLIAAILIQIIQDQDIHKLERYIGVFLPAFKTDIPVYRFGDQEEDDNLQFGCLTLDSNFGEKIRIDKFGQIQAATRIAQASIEAHYKMALTF